MITKIIYYDITKIEGGAIADREEPLEYQIVGEVLEENEVFITLAINKCISEDDLEENRMNIKFIVPKGCIKARTDFYEVKK